MKRAGFLIEKIADINNLHKAFHKACKGRNLSKPVIEFRENFDENIRKLSSQIINAKVSVGNYHYFKIYDPKERTICAASFSERILHHAIINVCHYYFEKYQIEDSFATRVGKGQFAALNRAKQFVRKYKYFVKLDVRKYFDNINHTILLNKLSHIFKDSKLMTIFDDIINSYSVNENSGVPIGNLTSQYFANFYLAFVDRFAKQELCLNGYVRYMDDIVFWGNDKSKLLETANKFIEFVESELYLKLKPIVCNKSERGLSFLGFVLFPNLVRLNKLSKRRFIKKFNDYGDKLDSSIWSQEDYCAHILPLFSFTSFANTENFRRKVI